MTERIAIADAERTKRTHQRWPRTTATLLVALAALLAAPTQAPAQSVGKLVGNLDKSGAGLVFLLLRMDSQVFTTGSNEDGYTLSSVELHFLGAPASGTTSVSLWSVSDGLPAVKIADLNNPPSFSSGVNAFTAPPATMLSKDTSYTVVVSGSDGALWKTTADGEAEDGQAGWSIADGSRNRCVFGGCAFGPWSALLTSSLKMRVNGAVGAADSDTTLSVLSLEDGDGNAIALAPSPFVPARTDYTAWVASAVDSATLTAAANDANATVAIAGDDDATTAAEAAFDLAAGANPLTVTVTAADRVQTGTYTVTVARAAAAPAADPDAIWNANLTVGTSGGGADAGYHGDDGVGALAPHSFTHDSATVAVGQLVYRTTGRLVLHIIGTGTLAAGEYLLEVGGQSFSVSHDGAEARVAIDAPDLDWGYGDVVPVKLLVDTAAPSDATLSALDLADDDGNPITLTPAAFDPATESYTATVPHHIKRVELFATANRPGATASIRAPGGGSPQSDNATGRLAVGSNTFTVTVTAQDDNATNTYTLTVTRLKRLRARFVDLPETHDGSTSFQVTIRFRGKLASPLANLEQAVEVTNGTMSNLGAVGSSMSRYRMDITPGSAAPIRIAVRSAASCSESHALCSAGGRLFSSDLVGTVSTADDARLRSLWLVDENGTWVARTPNFKSHILKYEAWEFTGGIDVTLHAVPYTSGATVTVKGPASVTVAARDDGGVNATFRPQGAASTWRVRVTSANGEVTRTYAVAVYASTARGPRAAAVHSPPAISVADAEVHEAPNARLAFAVTLDRAATTAVTVDYATADGTATAGADYTATSGVLTFAVGEDRKTIEVAVLDDAIDEGNETLTLALSNAAGASIADGLATGTIRNTDPLPRAWTARFGRTAAGHVLEAVEARLRGAPGTRTTVAGRLLDGSADVVSERAVREAAEALWADSKPRAVSIRELASGSSFVVSAPAADGAADGSGGSRWTVWGRGAWSGFTGNDDGVAVDGDVVTGTLGADWERGRLLMGLALAYSAGGGRYEPDSGSGGDLESRLASVHPYVRLALHERVELWGLLGYGMLGELRLSAGEVSSQGGLGMEMGAFGARGTLLAAHDTGGLELAAKADGLLVRITSAATDELVATEADVTRWRLLLEGTFDAVRGPAGVLTPSLEVGARYDGGAAETGAGVELGGGLRYAYPPWGLAIAANGRVLMAHQDREFREWGAGASLRVAPGPAGRGPSLTLNGAWGNPSSGAEHLWSEGAGAPADVAAGRVEAEVGYGMEVGGGSLVTPYAGFALKDGSLTYRLGGRLDVGGALRLDLGAERRETDAAPEHGLGLSGTLSW